MDITQGVNTRASFSVPKKHVMKIVENYRGFIENSLLKMRSESRVNILRTQTCLRDGRKVTQNISQTLKTSSLELSLQRYLKGGGGGEVNLIG